MPGYSRNRPTAVRRDLSDPETIAQYLRSGIVWKYPVFWQDGLTAIEKGIVPLDECKDVPPEVMELLTREGT
jgi:hypothetical protein